MTLCEVTDEMRRYNAAMATWLPQAIQEGVRHFFPEIPEDKLEEVAKIVRREVEPEFPAELPYPLDEMEPYTQLPRLDILLRMRSIRWSIISSTLRSDAEALEYTKPEWKVHRLLGLGDHYHALKRQTLEEVLQVRLKHFFPQIEPAELAVATQAMVLCWLTPGVRVEVDAVLKFACLRLGTPEEINQIVGELMKEAKIGMVYLDNNQPNATALDETFKKVMLDDDYCSGTRTGSS